MKNSKTIFFLGALAVLVIVVALAVVLQKDKVSPGPSLAEVKISGAQAQTYAVDKTPAVAAGDLIFGAAAAPLKVFVYEDYANLYSANLADTLEKINQASGDKLAIIARPFILKNSPLSEPAALLVACASDSGKGKGMRALVFAQVKNNLLNQDKFAAYAAQLGMDANKLAACLTNSQKSEKMDESQTAAAAYGVIGAPTIFIGGEMIVGARPYDDYVDSSGDKIEGLKTLVDRKLGE